jgi:hypothetical protein
MTKRSQSHAEFGKLVLRVQQDKESIEKKLARGLSMTELAGHYKTTTGSFKSAMDAIGIERPAHQGHSAKGKLFNDLVIVVARLASQLNVDCSEIKPYLNEQ